MPSGRTSEGKACGRAASTDHSGTDRKLSTLTHRKPRERALKIQFLPGTLEVVILKILALRTNRGSGITSRIRDISRHGVALSQGSLHPALHELESNGHLASEMTRSVNNRRARVYRLTALGAAPRANPQLGALRPIDAAHPRG